jgi:hypothetical protein
MRLILAVAMYNETEHAAMQLDNALKMGIYDEIVVLDDASIDGTRDILEEYRRKFNNIHVFRNKNNSILSHGENRWKTLSELIRDNNYLPDWVHIRAADVLCPIKYAKNLKDRIESQPPQVCYMGAPYICLWRSLGWYRVDGDWGGWAYNNNMMVFWRYNKNFSWSPNASAAGFHTGNDVPTDLGFNPSLGSGLLSPITKPPLFGLIHYGTCSHRKMENRFRWNMHAASASAEIGKNMGIPVPAAMPEVVGWIHFNGYKMVYEFDIVLAPSRPDWFDGDANFTFEPMPKIESFYEVIKEFNPVRAEEYKRLFEQTFGK